MALTNIICANPFHAGDNCYTVVAYLGAGRAAYHEGPKDYAFFTKEEAEILAGRVSRAGQIDLAHWIGHESPEEHYAELEARWDEYAFQERAGWIAA